MSDEMERLSQRWERERKARKEAEKLLEEKSLQLFQINAELVTLAESLAEKEEWSRSILEAAAEGIITIDENGRILSINRAAESLFGFSLEEIAEQSIELLFPENILGFSFFEFVSQDREYSPGTITEISGLKKDGEVFPLELSISWAKPGFQQIYIAFVRDITARKQAEQAVIKTNREIQMILETVVEGIFGVDCDGNFTFVNSAAANLLGWASDELTGQHSHELIHQYHENGRMHPPEECPIYHTVYEGPDHAVLEDVFWRKDGTPVPVEYFSRAIWDEDKVVGAVVSFRDISERKEAEKDRLKIEVQLRQAQKLEAIGQLAAGIAHEINTPTQYVSDNTHFVQEAVSDIFKLLSLQQQFISGLDLQGGELDELLARINEMADEIDIDYLKDEIPVAIGQSMDGLQRISKIVHAMKEFSHPGADEKTPTDINSAIQTTIDVSRNEWKYIAELVTDLDPGLPLVELLPNEFNQVILNLIVNAAHAIQGVLSEEREKGEIHITTHSDEEWVEIRVSDNGTGMPVEIRNRIFDPFFTTKEVGKGTGQGLAITWSVIVDKHGGSIAVESEEGEGSAFIVRLPITQDRLRGKE